MKRTRIGISGAAEGAARRWGMPKSVDNAPRCIVKVDWPKCIDGAVRLDLEAVAFAEYIVGADTNRPAGTGRGLPQLVKGRANQPVAMFASHPKQDAEFGMRWLKRDPALGGQDGSRWRVDQAWCVHQMRRPMYAKNYRQSPKEQRQFRVRLCPDPVAGVPLAEAGRMEELTRKFMAGVEQDFADETKTKAHFVWIAAAHYNVSHPHVHIGVRGITIEGDHVFFSQKYLRPTQRQLELDPKASGPIDWRARNVLAEMLSQESSVRHAG